jgi:hypothetical protein
MIGLEIRIEIGTEAEAGIEVGIRIETGIIVR